MLRETGVAVETLPEPTPGPDDALVSVIQAGVCATDLQLIAGYAGFTGVLGHEFVGRLETGQRVVADINLACGACPACSRGDTHHCARRRVLGIRDAPGVFAERVAIPRDALVPVPDTVDDDRAVFAEPLAAALHVADEIQGAEDVTVLGDGKLGLLIALSLHGAGHRVRLIGRHRDKLQLAADAGVATLLDRELDGSARHSASAVVEATGRAEGLQSALQLVRPRGTIVLKTTVAQPTSLDLSTLVVNELRLIGSRCGDMRRALAALESGAVDPTPLITARYRLTDADRALEHAARRGALKVLLVPGGGPGAGPGAG